MAESKEAALLAKYEKSGMLPKVWDSVDYLTLLIFSEGSDFAAAIAALKRMKSAFIDYNDIRAARWPEVARALDPLPAADTCTHRLIDLLFRLFDHFGMMSLRTLGNRTAAEAKNELAKLEPQLAKEAAQVALFGIVPNMPLNSSDAALSLAKDYGLISRTGNRVNLQKTLLDSGLPPEKYGALARFLEIEAALNSIGKKSAAKEKSATPKKKAPAAKANIKASAKTSVKANAKSAKPKTSKPAASAKKAANKPVAKKKK